MNERGIKRREFLGKSALGLITAGFGLKKLYAGIPGQERSNQIVYRTLGRTNLRIPVVSFGVMNSDSPDLINQALEKGVNHLDTAHLYLRGNSERVIGEVLENSGKRDQVFVATKMRLARDREKRVFSLEGTDREPPATAESLYRQLDISLKRLKTDYVDILYLHSCYSPQMATYEPLMNALVKVKEQGKARFIGTSTHTDEPNVIRATVDAKVYDVVLTAYNFAQEHKDDVKKAIAHAAKKGVGVIAMKTQGGRRLQEERKVEINHKSALKWVLDDENVCTTIPGMTTFEQLETNISVMNDMALTQAERSYLDWAAQMKGKLYCQNCRSCIPTCPHSVEFPNLMRAYMYASAYGNYIQARTTVSEIPETQSLNVCRNCSSCRASCRTGINIRSRLQTLIADELYLT
jgi:predicted aldo/keto reductase-like oxidoreductase